MLLTGVVSMLFKRKVYQKLLEWKEQYSDHYAVLLEGPRRVGKSTIVKEFAKNEYESYILIDFAHTTKDMLSCFDDIGDLNLFFLRLQATAGKTLKKGRSVIVFDEVQLFPAARQAIKYLVQDGRYHYIETGSLISIRKNVRDIVIPSEEMRIQMDPMDYEEFLDASSQDTYQITKTLWELKKPLGQALNRKLMRDFRIYMAVGGMPQAVEAYLNGNDFAHIDQVKREIIHLYEDDFRKIDPSGSISMMYRSIPAQLSRDIRRYRITGATGKAKRITDNERLYDLISSRTVLICYESTDPGVNLSLTRNLDVYKLYTADTGLFVTLLFMDRSSTENTIYAKLLADKLPANLGYLYENAVAQMIRASGRELYYHTWEKENSTHYYETDFLLSQGSKVIPVEVKSSGTGKHESLTAFMARYQAHAKVPVIVSQKDLVTTDGILNVPVYMVPHLLDEISRN